MKILIEKTSKTPYVHFDNGSIEIKGRSILEDSTQFYEPLLNWLEEYIKKPAPKTHVRFAIEYSNSNSNKFIFKMIHLLETCYLEGNDINIDWMFEKDDDAIKDLGRDLKTLLKIPLNLIEYNN